jgi:acyl-CoA synthetase (AMP-forming)/AMP-acid ligase II
MPGYHNDPKKNAEVFDEEGFYCLGDAVKFVDEADPNKGLIFDGRVGEDFKLSSGTWVSVGTLRPDFVAACSPLIFDAVICGQDKDLCHRPRLALAGHGGAIHQGRRRSLPRASPPSSAISRARPPPSTRPNKARPAASSA